MWELNPKEGWAPKNWCFWAVVLENTLESPLDSKEIKLINPKGNQSWIFIGRTDAETEAPILWPPDVKGWLFGKDFDAGKDWKQEEKGTTEDEMVGWHHRLNGHELEQTLGDGEERDYVLQSMGHKESDWMIEWLNNFRIMELGAGGMGNVCLAPITNTLHSLHGGNWFLLMTLLSHLVTQTFRGQHSPVWIVRRRVWCT